jgi:hypothetical protein
MVKILILAKGWAIPRSEMDGNIEAVDLFN